MLRDYHTVSDHRGGPLPSTQVNAKGEQKNTSPAKPTYVTQRFYLQDAVFVVALGGPSPLVKGLEHAVRNPAFPLSLGRRSCPPAQPLLLPRPAGPNRDKTWNRSLALCLGKQADRNSRSTRTMRAIRRPCGCRSRSRTSTAISPRTTYPCPSRWVHAPAASGRYTTPGSSHPRDCFPQPTAAGTQAATTTPSLSLGGDTCPICLLSASTRCAVAHSRC
ncbi:MAG TPA: hypothetical protein H9836_03495 [Candidatus Nocardiopsis merdipullorum]|nr:hypothetical protein [Candidatus Nocardiopsis merdipullorum]